MSAREPAEASTLFERYFADSDLKGLMSLYEEDAVFPTPHGTSTGHDQIRATLKAYLDSGAKLVFGESLVFPAGDLALIHTPWTMQMPDGSTPTGATAEVVRRQPDGSWKYIIDNPDGTALLSHEQCAASACLGLLGGTPTRFRPGGVATYQDVYKLTYVRGPSGIIVMLAEELKKG